MIPIFMVIVAAFLYLFSGIAIAGKSYGARLCQNDSQFLCYKVKKGDTWESVFANENAKIVGMKINRTNVKLHPGMIISIPKGANLALLDAAPFEKQIEPTGHKVIFVSLTNLAWGAYDTKGNLVNWGPVSGGKGYCADVGSRCVTPVGNFAVYRKGGFDCKSSKFPVGKGGAPMPHCMFFKGGVALHGSYDVPGYHASHGCVRLFVNDAQWLNQDFVQDDKVPVIVRQL